MEQTVKWSLCNCLCELYYSTINVETGQVLITYLQTQKDLQERELKIVIELCFAKRLNSDCESLSAILMDATET